MLGALGGHTPQCSTPSAQPHSQGKEKVARGADLEPLESKLQLEKLFQTAIITHQHVFYFRFNQVPQNARLPHPHTQQRSSPASSASLPQEWSEGLAAGPGVPSFQSPLCHI